MVLLDAKTNQSVLYEKITRFKLLTISNINFAVLYYACNINFAPISLLQYLC